jgi:hypothetical protein
MGGAALFLLVGGWLIYELGLSRAGFARMEAVGEIARLQAENRELAARNKELSERLASLEVGSKVDREAYAQVESELVALQTRILEQQEDIEFYKGIVNENDGTGLRIQDFEIAQGIGEREYDVRLVLAQAFRSDRQVSGQVDLVVEGVQRGKAARLDMAALAPADESGKPMKYSFRYFQDLKAALVLPEDFAPERVHVIIKTQGKSAKTVEEFFIWEVKPG